MNYLVSGFSNYQIMFPMGTIVPIIRFMVFLRPQANLSIGASLGPFFVPIAVNYSIRNVTTLHCLRPNSVLLPIFMVTNYTKLTRRMGLFGITIGRPLVIMMENLFRLRYALSMKVLLTNLLPILVIIFPPRYAIGLMMRILSILLSSFMRTFRFRFPIYMRHTINAIRFTKFMKFLFHRPTFIIVFPRSSILPALLMKTLNFRLIMSMFFMVTVMGAVLRANGSVNKVMTISGTILSIGELITQGFPIRGATISRVCNYSAICQMFFLYVRQWGTR